MIALAANERENSIHITKVVCCNWKTQFSIYRTTSLYSMTVLIYKVCLPGRTGSERITLNLWKSAHSTIQETCISFQCMVNQIFQEDGPISIMDCYCRHQHLHASQLTASSRLYINCLTSAQPHFTYAGNVPFWLYIYASTWKHTHTQNLDFIAITRLMK